MQLPDTIQVLKESLREHEQLLAKLEHRLPELPAGSLYIKRQNEKEYYLRRLTYQGKRLQLPIPQQTRDGRLLTSELYEKRAIYHGLPVLRRNTFALRKALQSLSVYDPEGLSDRWKASKTMLENTAPADTQHQLANSGITLPDWVFLPRQLNVGKWIADTKAGRYRTNPAYPEERNFESSRGFWVRSKSEGTWDDALTEALAAFRYESALLLKNGKTVYPDFTVLHPQENRLILIEHFGRMDDSKYAMKSMRKLKEYAESGYILGRDLFFTMETKDLPLTRRQVDAVMRQIGL